MAHGLFMNVKYNLRTELQKYCATEISNSVSFTNYDKIVRSAYSAVKGSFTPTEDKSSITISQIPKQALYILVECKELCKGKPAGYQTAITGLSKQKAVAGEIRYYNSSGNQAVQTIAKTGVVDFNSDGTITLKPSSGKVFRAGFTYDYYIIGGYAV